MGKWLTCLPRLSLAQLQPTLWSTTGCACRRDLEKFPWPRWENTLLTCPIRFSSFLMGAASSTSMEYVPSAPETSKVPIAPMGISHVLRLCLQGGGVYILSGTVTFLSCTVTGNTAYHVHAHAQTSHRPDGKMADMPKSTLIFRFWIDIWFYQGYVRASHACKLPIAPMGKLLTHLL